MANYIDTDTVSWLPFGKPIRNPYVKIELTKEQKENLNKWNIGDEPWAEANDILKKEDYFYATLGRCNGKSDGFNALVYALNAYKKIEEEEMGTRGVLIINPKDITRFDYTLTGMCVDTVVKGTATIEVELPIDVLEAFKKDWKEIRIQQIQNYVASRPNGRHRPEIEKVIFNPPATIVIWHDKSKTVVKCREDDEYDPEYGLAMCIAKKYFGSRHQMQKLVEENYEEPDCTYMDPDYEREILL